MANKDDKNIQGDSVDENKTPIDASESDEDLVNDNSSDDGNVTKPEIDKTEDSDDVASTEENEPEINPEKTIEEAMQEAESTSSDVFQSNTEIDKAVDDIVRTESDESIAETDAKLAASASIKNKKSFKQRLKDLFWRWWENKPARYGVLTACGLLLILFMLLPATRYGILNLFGVRVSSSMTVIDSQTRLPLKNINVALQDKTSLTDEDGKVVFDGLKIGKSTLSITKLGYADNTRDITLGWGSNPIGNQEIIATGEQFTFVLSDWKNNEPITDAEASAGENSARADDSGKIILTVGEENIANVEVHIAAEGYRTEIVKSEQLVDGEIKIHMVPGRKHVFVSNRSGEFDLYKIDVDAKNEEILLASTGKEREVPVALPHPTRDLAAFVSSREGDENSEGFVLDGLFLVDVISGDAKRIARSEQLQLIGWSGDSLIFWQVVEGTSRGNPQRSKLISYNERTEERIELASANYFNDVKMVGNTVYYAVSSYAVPQSQAKLYSVNIDGTSKVKVIDFQVWDIFRTGHNTLLFSAANQKWYEKQGEADVEEVSQQPVPSSRQFVDSPSGKRTAWVEVRDGKGVLLVTSTDNFKEEQVLSLPGLSEVLYWANDSTVIFRIISNSETADYVLNLDVGGEQKIVDVTASRNTYF